MEAIQIFKLALITFARKIPVHPEKDTLDSAIKISGLPVFGIIFQTAVYVVLANDINEKI